jgi:hypothetical protein
MPSSMTLAEEVGESVEPAAADPVTVDPLHFETNGGIKLLDGYAEEDDDINLINPDDAGTAGKTSILDAKSPSIFDQLQFASAHAGDSMADPDVSVRVVPSNHKPPTGKKPKRKPVLPKRDPTNPVIVILDSLGSTRTNAVRALKSWLKAEGMEKRGMEVEIKEKGLYPKASQIPMQDNFSDCGVFVLGYATKFLQDPDTFRIKILTGEMSAHTDWPDMKPSVMRTDLRNILFDLHKKQAEARRAEYKAKKQMRNRMPLTPATSQPTALRLMEATQERTNPHEMKSATIVQVKPNAPLKPRLESPFHHEPQCAPSKSRSPSAQKVLKVSDSPPVPINGEPSVALPGKKQSPVVLIPVDQKPRDDYNRHTAFGRHSGAARESTQPAIASSSLQQYGHDATSSPVRPHTSEGDSDHPIQIEESQESLALEKPIHRPKTTIDTQTTRPVTRLPQKSTREIRHQTRSEDFESDPMDVDNPPKLQSVHALAIDIDIDDPVHVQQASQVSERSSIGETPTPERSSPVPNFKSPS